MGARAAARGISLLQVSACVFLACTPDIDATQSFSGPRGVSATGNAGRSRGALHPCSVHGSAEGGRRIPTLAEVEGLWGAPFPRSSHAPPSAVAAFWGVARLRGGEQPQRRVPLQHGVPLRPGAVAHRNWWQKALPEVPYDPAPRFRIESV